MTSQRSKVGFERIGLAAIVLLIAACHPGGSSVPPAQTAPADDERHDLPVTDDDLRIVDRADALLSSETVWNRADTRDCPQGAPTLSLFCALHAASIEILGAYDHRRAALQEVRFVIEERGKDYDHRLMGFNNDPSTTFADTKLVLHAAKERLQKRLHPK